MAALVGPRRLAALEAWMAAAEQREWQDGQWDCLMAPCDWARRLTGVDPAAAWRGRYDSADQAEAILLQGGGMTRLVDRTLRPLGWRRTRRPLSGDFGVVRLSGAGSVAFGAVRYGDRWAVATTDGMLFAKAATRMAWTWPEENDDG